MNSTSFTESTNSMTTTIETWFIPLNILMIVCTTSSIILSALFLLIIILDKTCHTVSMMLIANSCLTSLILGSLLLSFSIFTFENDLKQTSYEDSHCIFRAYIGYFSASVFHYSLLLQALYRYIIVVYPNYLFCQSAKFQRLSICLTWIFSLIHPLPYMFNNEIIYDVNNQICQLPFRLSFSLIYMSNCVYIIPVLLTMLIYFKLVRYVRGISKRVTSVNILIRARRELKMVQRIVILISILLTLGIPYTVFIFMSFFTTPPKYHFRIAFAFVDVSLPCVMIALFQFTDPLKASIMKRINARPDMVVAAIV